jgi:hypothetical protein
MGVYLHYQAMPEDSRLARRLRSERPLCVLYCELIHRPAGPYDTVRLRPEELDDYLAEIARNPVFGSRAAVDRVYSDLQAELARAAEEFPGLPKRVAYFKLHDFGRHLARALARAGRADAEELADKFVMGAGRFAPDGFGTGDVQLQVVSPPLVAEAAALFRGVDPASFAGWEEEWAAFRGVYAEAAPRGEAVMIA